MCRVLGSPALRLRSQSNVTAQKQLQDAVKSRKVAFEVVQANRQNEVESRDETATIMLFVSVATLFLLAHAYRGIWQDAILVQSRQYVTPTPSTLVHDLSSSLSSKAIGRSTEGLRASNIVDC